MLQLRHGACRLQAAGLLPLCRMIENRDEAGKRFDFDRSLIAAWIDRWRPETQTFHMPCGEMVPTLQDVSYLLGLPLAGAAVGPIDGQARWKEEIHDRFALVMLRPEVGPVQPMSDYVTGGPSKPWLSHFLVRSVTYMFMDRCLLAHLLILMCTIFTARAHG